MKNFYSLTIKDKKKSSRRGYDFRRHLTKIIYKWEKKWLISLVIKEIQIKASVSHYTPNKTAT